MASNADYFPGGQPTRDVLLAARGFGAKGERSGGIVLGSGPVVIPAGAPLLRLHHVVPDFGQWWLTPYELSLIAAHFAVDGAAFARGRTHGRSILHGCLAILHEWAATVPGAGPNPAQLGRFQAAVPKTDMFAMYGEGDVAVTPGFGRVLKPILLDAPGGGQRGARQVFLPRAWEYEASFDKVPLTNTATDADLLSMLRVLGWTKLAFE